MGQWVTATGGMCGQQQVTPGMNASNGRQQRTPATDASNGQQQHTEMMGMVTADVLMALAATVAMTASAMGDGGGWRGNSDRQQRQMQWWAEMGTEGKRYALT